MSEDMEKDNQIKIMKIEKQVLSKMLEMIINEYKELKQLTNEYEELKKAFETQVSLKDTLMKQG